MPILSREQLEQFQQDGYLVIPGFFSEEQTSDMRNQARRLLDDFKIQGHPMTTFTTEEDGEHVGDEYFLNSGDKIRYFLEPSSLSTPTATEPAKLLVPPNQSINKIGHALAQLDPVFRKYTLEEPRIAQLAKEIQVHKSPRVLQSMIICKQPKIGGKVPVHNDSTFLYTDPPSAIGAWVALEDCTATNGCLSFLPGSHKRARIASRFVRLENGGTGFEAVPGVKPNDENWGQEDGWRQAACKAGALVLIHGSVMHLSPPNHSDKSRLIYTFHMIEGDGAVYDSKNWLQPTKDMPFPKLF